VVRQTTTCVNVLRHFEHILIHAKANEKHAWYLPPEVAQLHERVLPVLSYGDRTSRSYHVPRVQRAQSTIPATLIGNWEIAGIRSGDVSQSENITVIGHLKLLERKVTFECSYGAHLAKCLTWRCALVQDRIEQNRLFQYYNFQYYRIHDSIIYSKRIVSLTQYVKRKVIQCENIHRYYIILFINCRAEVRIAELRNFFLFFLEELKACNAEIYRKITCHEYKFTLFIAVRNQRASLLTYLSVKQTNII